LPWGGFAEPLGVLFASLESSGLALEALLGAIFLAFVLGGSRSDTRKCYAQRANPPGCRECIKVKGIERVDKEGEKGSKGSHYSHSIKGQLRFHVKSEGMCSLWVNEKMNIPLDMNQMSRGHDSDRRQPRP